MESTKECAYKKSNGYCLLHKCDCSVECNCACSDCVKKANHIHNAYGWLKREYNWKTPKGRMQYRTENYYGYLVYSQCTGKTRYPNEKRAKEVLKARMRGGAGYLRVYYCKFCSGYHLTHKEDRVINVAA